MRFKKNSPAIWVALILLNPAYAADMKINPGQWEFRSTTSLPTPGGPKEHVNVQCFTDPTITPETMMKDMQHDCRLLESDSDGTSMSWKVSCSGGGGEMTGVGNVTSAGDKIKGGMKMIMSFNGQAMNMDVSWAGIYIGPCP